MRIRLELPPMGDVDLVGRNITITTCGHVFIAKVLEADTYPGHPLLDVLAEITDGTA